MARTEKKLTALKVASLKKAGRHSDGGGLYLNVSKSGARSWLFMWSKDGRRREMGLGALNYVSLADARDKVGELRKQVASGEDPIEIRKSKRARLSDSTFGDACQEFLDKNEMAWRNEKHRQQWRSTLETYCKVFWSVPVKDVSTENVLACLQPIWQEKPETASRLRGRIERVLDFARVRGWRDGENPARWKGHLKAILPARHKLTRGHHRALPFSQLPTFMENLRCLESISALALQFCILTATRSGETLGARWSEVDLENAIWTIPPDRMKAGREHRVPLSSPVMDMLEKLHENKVSEFVFPGNKINSKLSNMSMIMILRRMQADATVHGFRSTFRDWVGETTAFSREVAEQALAHSIGDETERAYRRGDALDKRRRLMDAWANYCRGEANEKIVVLAAG